MSITLSVVAAVNDERLLDSTLMRSPMIASGEIPVVTERGHASASAAYNAGMSRTSSDYVIFAHQDVYFPLGWQHKLRTAISALNTSGRPWGALGVQGVNANWELIGKVWCGGNHREFGIPPAEPQQIVSLDEIVLVLKLSTNFRFDERLPGYHLYGTDIVLSLQELGYVSYAFDAPIIHNTKPIIQLDRGYTACYRYIQSKWSNRLPIPTTVMKVTRWGWPLYERRLRKTIQQIRGRIKVHERCGDPRQLAETLGYELLEGSSTR